MPRYVKNVTKVKKAIKKPTDGVPDPEWKEYIKEINIRKNKKLKIRCEICGTDETFLHRDHDHKTNKIRGILCVNCNKKVWKLEKFWDWYDEYKGKILSYLGKDTGIEYRKRRKGDSSILEDFVKRRKEKEDGYTHDEKQSK